MSINFTPAPPAVKSCTQSPAPVLHGVNTTALPFRKKVYRDDDAKPCAASFFLLFSYRRKRFAYGYHPLPDAKKHTGSTHNSLTTVSQFNTSCFMRKLVSKSGLLAMIFMVVSLFVVNDGLGQIAQVGAATSNTSTNASVTINKPSGIQVGDIMLANILQHDASTGDDLTAGVTSSGWTVITNTEFSTGTDPEYRGTLLYKIAVTSDLSANNYAFSGNSSVVSTIGAIVAFRGVSTTNPFDVTPGTTMTTGSDNAYNAASITTATPNAAVIMFGMVGDDRTASGWSTATSPGTLTELFDIISTNGDDSGIGAAWAIKASPGATGAGSAALNGFGDDFVAGKLIALRSCAPTISSSGAIAPVCFSTSPQTASLTYSATTNDPVSYTIDWNNAANAAGLADQNTTAHAFVAGGGTITNVAVPGSVTPGSYNGTMTVTNASGCSVTQAVSISINAPQVTSFAASAATICNGETAQLVMTITGAGPYTVVYNNGVTDVTEPGVVSGTPFNATPSNPTSETTFTLVSVTGTDGCFRDAAMGFTDGTASVSVRDLPTASISVNNTSACQFAAGPEITFTGSSATGPPYTFTYTINGVLQPAVSAISGSSTTIIVPTNISGIFTYELVSVAYGNSPNCTNLIAGQSVVTIIAAPNVEPILGGASSVCVNAVTPAFTNATTGGTWSIIDGTGSATIEQDGVVTGVSTGTVTVVYTYSDGTCSNTATTSLTIIAPPTTANAGEDKSICHPHFTGSPSVNMQANTPLIGTGTWSIISGPSTDLEQLANINNPTTVFSPNGGIGVYTLQWTISNAPCSSSDDQVQITVVMAPPTPPAPINTTAAPHCANPGVVLGYGDAVPETEDWFWQTSPDGTQTGVINSATTFTVTASGSTTVYLRARSIGETQCWSDASSITVVLATPPATPGSINGTSTICTPGATGLTYSINNVATATSYTWSVPAGWNIILGQGTNSISVDAGASGQNGSITVTANNDCGSSNAASLSVSVSTVNDIGFGSPATNEVTICAGTTGTAITGGDAQSTPQYQWQVSTTGPTGSFGNVIGGGGTGQTYTINTTYFSNAGTYHFRRVSSSSGCNGNSDVVILTVNPLPSVSVSGGGTACVQATLTAEISGPVSGTIYFQGTNPNGTSEETPSSSQVVTTSGTYYFRALSAMNCWGPANSATVTINIPPVISTPAFSICQGDIAPVATATADCVGPNVSQTFNSSDQFMVPVGVSSITVEAWGAGGGGSSFTNTTDGSGGGGGGAYTRGTLAVTPGPLAITVGTGGTVGNPGGSSSVGSIVANGGGSSNSAAGGSGGTASAIGGNILASFAGGSGGNGNTSGISNNTSGGGSGGGSAFTNNQGNNGNTGGTSNTAGATGGTGTGNGGNGGVQDGNPAAQSGSAPGGGGGGRGEDNGSSAAGANGRVIITYASPTNILWYDAPTGGNLVHTGADFDPTNALPGGSTNTPGTYTFYAECSLNPDCRSAVTYEIVPKPIVKAVRSTVTFAAPLEVCASNLTATPIVVAAQITNPAPPAGGVTLQQWFSASGHSGFNNPNGNTTSYTPSAQDLQDGIVKLYFNTTNPTGPCGVLTSDTVVFTIYSATVDAGPATATICSNQTLQLNGVVTVNAVTPMPGVTWSTSGDGTFSPDASTLDAIYTPGSIDSTNGQVVLTLTTADPEGPCNVVSDQIIVTVNPAPKVPVITGPAIICPGSGGFDNNYFIPNFSGETYSWTWQPVIPEDYTGVEFATAPTGPEVYVGQLGNTNNVQFNLLVTAIRTSNGCTEVSAPFTVDISAPVPALQSQTNVACHGNNTGAINIDVTGGTGSYTYAWTTTDGVIPGGQEDDKDLTGLVAGTYTLTVTDATNFCSHAESVISVTITEPDAITVSNADVTSDYNGSQLSCNVATDGQITIVAAGGTAPLSYTLSGGTLAEAVTNETGIFSDLGTGTYSYSVTDINSCEAATGNVTITAPDPISISSATVTSDHNGSQLSCTGATDGQITIVAIGGTTPLSYTLSGGTLAEAVTNEGGVFSGLGAGTYDYSVTDANNCVAVTGNVTITAPDPISVSSAAVSSNYNGSQLSCNGALDGEITIAANGGTGVLTYTLTGGSLTESVQNNTGIFSGLGAGTYDYTVTDVNSCEPATGSVTITAPDAITASGAVTSNYNGSQVSCSGATDGEITVTASGGTAPLSYTLSGGTLAEAVTNETGVFSDLGAGTYEYSVTDANSCEAATGSVIITAPDAITAGGSVTSNYNGSHVSSNGAVDGEITITASGGTAPLSYTLSGGTLAEAVTNETGLFSGLGAGTYNYSVTDANNCEAATGTVTITEPDAITAGASVTSDHNGSQLSCNGAIDGEITITASGGTAPLSYTLSGGTLAEAVTNETGVFSGLGAGEYHFSVTDVNNSPVSEGNITITAPDAITASGEVTSNYNGSQVSCSGVSDGAITITASGGTTPLSYTLTGGTLAEAVTNETGVFSGLGAGTYEYSVTDANNCEAATGSVVITAPAVITASGEVTSNYNGSQVSCFASADGEITVTASGGTAPLSYTLSGGTLAEAVTNETGVFSGLGAGTYEYSVTDANNCEAATGNVVITAPPVITASGEVTSDYNGSHISCNGALDGQITITASGGTVPLSYTLSYTLSGGTLVSPVTQEANGVFSGLGAGTYTYSVTDVNDCEAATGTVTITEPEAITASVSPTQPACFGNTGSATVVDLTGGTGSYTYEWSNGQNTATATDLAIGDYSVTITDENGCSITLPVTISYADVTAPDITNCPANANRSTDALACAYTIKNGEFNITVNDECPLTYTYQLSGATVTPGAVESTNLDGVVLLPGITHIIWTVSDGLHTSTCEFDVTVSDQVAPAPDVAELPDITGECAAAVNAVPTATDNCAGPITGTTSSPLSYNTVGEHTVVWQFNDGNGNISFQNQKVIVTDNADPVPSVATLPDLVGQCGVNVTTIPTALDNCAGLISATTTDPFVYNTPGEYQITWVYNDGNGHVVVQYQDVIVKGIQDFMVTHDGSACNGGVTIGLESSETGVTYQLIRNSGAGNINVGAPLAGSNGNGLEFGTFTMAGTYSVRATSVAEGCTSIMPGTFVISSAALPTAFMVTSSGSVCNTGVTITLTSSQAGVTYNLIKTDNSINTLVATFTGTGFGNNFGPYTEPGIYSIQATNAAGCTNTMTGTVTISSGAVPTAFAMTSDGSACSGGVTIGLESSQSNTSYQLVRNGNINIGAPLTGNGNALEFGSFTTAGTYSVVATSQAGCTGNMSGTVIVSAGTPPTAFPVTSTGSVCSGGVAIILTSSQSGVTYRLIRTTDNISFLETTMTGNGFGLNFGVYTTAGIYTIQAETAPGGCINNMTGSVTISSGELPIAYTVTSSGSPCLGGVAVGLDDSETGVNYQLVLNGSINVGGTVAGSGFAISFGIQPQGTYTVVATRTGGCSNNMTGSVTVNAGTLPLVFNVTGGGSDCTGAGVPVGLSGSQDGINYQLKRNGSDVGVPVPGTGLAINFGNQTELGTYTVVATNATTSCTNNMTGSASVISGTLPLVFNVTGGGSDCSGAGVAVGLSGSQAGINYQLKKEGSDIGSPIPGTGLAISFGNQTAGTYIVVATNATTSCSSVMTGSATVVEGEAPSAAITNNTGTTELTCSTTSISVTATGGVSYLWNGGSTPSGATNSFSAAGTYTVTVTGANGCTSTASITITQDDDVPSAAIINNAGTTELTCSTTSISVTATGGVSYAWNNGLGNSADATITTAGTYTVTVTGANGCTSTASIVVTGNSIPPVAGIINNTGTTILSCNTTSISVTATGGVSYQWDGGLGSNASATITTAGTYTVTVTGANGCTSTASIAVTGNNAAPAAGITNNTGTTVLNCSTSSIQVTATGGVSYQWDGGLGSNAAATITNPGTYNVTVTGANGCTSTASITITQSITGPAAVIVNHSGTSVLTCNTAVINVEATNGVSYQWDGGSTPTSATNSFSSPGLYQVIVTGANGCTSAASINITQNTIPPPAAITNITGTTVLGCTTPAINVQATGGISYLWNGGLGNSADATITTAGTYTVTVTGANGCTSTASITVTGNSNPPVAGINNISGTTVLNCTTTSVNVQATGGVSYQWNGGLGNSASATITAAGTYTVTVTGANGCTATESITVTGNSTPPIAGITNNTGTTVLTCATTSISVTATGGGTYTWSGGLGNSASATITAAGTYTVTVTGANGCTATESITVTGNSTPPTAGITNNTGTTVLDCTTTSISVTATGGGTYAWSGGLGSSASATITAAGTYTVTVTGANGCTDTESITVTGNSTPPTAGITNNTGTTVLDCTTTSISVTATGGGTYAWSGGLGNSASATITAAGTYTVTVTGANGCTDTESITVTQNNDALPTVFNVTTTTPVSSITQTLFQVAEGPGLNSRENDGSAIELGMKFRATQNGFVTGIRYFKASGTTGTHKGNLWSNTGTLLATATFTSESASGWQQVSFSSPVAITAGVTYVASYFSPSGDYASTWPYFNQAKTNGVLRGLATGEDGLNGIYRYTTSSGFPSSSWNSSNYWVDVVFTTGASSCSGQEVGLSGSQSGVNYQLLRNGSSTPVTTVAGTGSAINFGSQSLAGTYTVAAVNATTGCTSNMTGSAVVSEGSNLPAVFNVTGGGSLCNGNVTVGLSGSQSGVSYQLFRSGTQNAVATANGTGSAINFPSQSQAGTYTVVATNTTTNCTSTMSGSASVTAGTLPNLYTVTGGGVLCNGDVAIGLSGSQSGISYQLFRTGTASAVATANGTGSAISFPNQGLAGTYTVVATNTTTSCTRNMTGNASVTAGTLPNLYTVTGGGSLCNGNVAVGLSGSQSGISYQLFRSGTASAVATANGTGSAISFPSQSQAGTYTVVATNTTTGCIRTMTGSASVTAGTLPNLYTVTGGGSLCNGNVAVGLSGSQSGISYQLFRSGTASAVATANGTGSAISFPAQSEAGTYTVVATNTTTGCTRTMTGSASVTAGTLPNLYTVTGTNNGSSTTQTLFSAGELPEIGRENDGTSLELGMRFRSTVNGFITGIRYYKGSGTTGTHRGNLWSNTGTLLATALFTGETASGWQQVLFSNPVPVTAGTTYVASYFSPSGDYAQSANYFTQAKVNGNLRGLANGENGSNGVYRYSTSSAFPTSTWNSANYWVDVMFTTSTSSCSVTIDLSGSQSGVSYQLLRNDAPVSTVAGTGSAISFGSQSLTGTYTVVATNNTTGCSRTMTGSATVNCTATKSSTPTNNEVNLITKGEQVTPEALKIDIAAFPNPSESYFNVKVSSPVKETVEVRMFDMLGRVVETRRGAPDQVLRFGDNAAAGMYILEARQPGAPGKATIKVIKQN